MRITLLTVGRTVDKNIIAGINDYTQRIGHFAQFNIDTIPELKNAKKMSEAQQKEAEGIPIGRIRCMDRTQAEHFDKETGIHCRRTIWILPENL